MKSLNKAKYKQTNTVVWKTRTEKSTNFPSHFADYIKSGEQGTLGLIDGQAKQSQRVPAVPQSVAWNEPEAAAVLFMVIDNCCFVRHGPLCSQLRSLQNNRKENRKTNARI